MLYVSVGAHFRRPDFPLSTFQVHFGFLPTLGKRAMAALALFLALTTHSASECVSEASNHLCVDQNGDQITINGGYIKDLSLWENTSYTFEIGNNTGNFSIYDSSNRIWKEVSTTLR